MNPNNVCKILVISVCWYFNNLYAFLHKMLLEKMYVKVILILNYKTYSSFYST